MARRLADNISSRYVEASDALRPGGRRKRRVVAYVESYDDIFFWRDVLSEFESEAVEFQVMLPSRTDLSRGKKQAMTNQLGHRLGKSMIACVDADYDYLLQGHTLSSQQMLGNRFVMHTFAYAIENYQCYAPSLREVCVMSTLNDRPAFDFERYLSRFSEIIYDLFVWTVWLYRQSRYAEFPLSQFLAAITPRHFNIQQPEQVLADLRRSVEQKTKWLRRKCPDAPPDFTSLKDELMQLGVSPQCTYLYVQGHHLLDNVVMAALEPTCTQLRREREKEIKRLGSRHRQQMENELASYRHSQCDVGQMLRRNTAYKTAPPYQQLRERIRQFLGASAGGGQEPCAAATCACDDDCH